MGSTYSPGVSEGLGKWFELANAQLRSQGPEGVATWAAGNGINMGGGAPVSQSSAGYPTPQNAQGAPAFQWQFPQYSQTWAFTPPAPTPYNLPPAFDPKSPTGYAKAPTPSKTALSPFSLPDIMAKYK